MFLSKSAEYIRRDWFILRLIHGYIMEISNNDTMEYYQALHQHGYLDLEAALLMIKTVGKTPDDLANLVQEFSDDTGTELKDIDPAYVAYDHVFQCARNTILERANIDLDDLGYTVIGDGMCSCFDCGNSENKLEKGLKKLSSDQKDILKDDLCVVEFLDNFDIVI